GRAPGALSDRSRRRHGQRALQDPRAAADGGDRSRGCGAPRFHRIHHAARAGVRVRRRAGRARGRRARATLVAYAARRSMVTGKLEGRRILLTGVSRGVGFATARLFLDEGATVFGVARDEVRLRNARAELGARALGRFEALALDLATSDAPARAAAWIGERW